MAVTEALAEALARRLAGILAHQCIEQPVHRRFLGLVLHRVAAAFLFQPHRFLDQVARDLLHVAPDIADLGELGRFHLHERRIGKLRQAAADLGLAAAGRADHQDVLGRHLVAQIGAELLPAPAVAQRHRNGTLRVLLSDDMRVERGDDCLGGKCVLHRARISGRGGRGSSGRACLHASRTIPFSR